MGGGGHCSICCKNTSQPSYGLTRLALVLAALVRADGAQPSLYIDDEYVHIRTVYIWPYGLLDTTIKLLSQSVFQQVMSPAGAIIETLLYSIYLYHDLRELP